ncbi:MAG TPA: YfiR family protein [Chromatiaceae bacterium]|nr:YfiR family protein [Chromatiaceae bacterium]
MQRACFSNLWHGVWLVMLSLALVPLDSYSAGPDSAEYKLKAALIYKLTGFIEWPKSSLKGRKFGICVLGRDDFGDALDALEARRVGNQTIHVRRFVQSEAVDAASCQILFVSESKRPFLRTILHSLAHYPILTIGDVKQFAESGGMIEFVRGYKRIGFKINLQQASKAGLKISAPLLDLSTIVDTAQP